MKIKDDAVLVRTHLRPERLDDRDERNRRGLHTGRAAVQAVAFAARHMTCE
jgi:hypothetical protein